MLSTELNGTLALLNGLLMSYRSSHGSFPDFLEVPDWFSDSESLEFLETNNIAAASGHSLKLVKSA